MPTITAECALKTKLQGDEQDYRVLKFSPRLSRAYFERVYTQLAVGELPFDTSNDLLQKPPWVTAGPIRDQLGNLYIALVCQTYTERLDKRGRPVTTLCCICVPYSEWSATPVGLLPIYKEIQPYDLDSAPEQITLTLKPVEQYLTTIEVAIKRMTYERLATIAALLLDGPVALRFNSKDPPNELERLGIFDALISLLPFGCRADLAVSTWMQSATLHQIRLGLSNEGLPFSKFDSTLLRPGSRAARYYNQLTALKERHGTLKLITFLASQVRTQRFDTPEPIFDTLRSFDPAHFVLQDVRGGTAVPAEIAHILRDRTLLQNLTPDERFELQRCLLKTPSQEQLALVRSAWDDALWPDLCALGQRSLEQPTEKAMPVLTELATFARERQYLSIFLGGLLDYAAQAPTSAAPRTVVTLLHKLLDRLGPDLGDVQMSEILRNKLVMRPSLLYAFLFQSEKCGRVKEGLAWLGPKLRTPGVILFAATCGLSPNDDPPLPPLRTEMLKPMVAVDRSYARQLFELATRKGQVGPLVPTIVDWLAQDWPRDRNELLDWKQQLSPTKLDPIQLQLSEELLFRMDRLLLAFDPTAQPERLFLEWWLDFDRQTFGSRIPWLGAQVQQNGLEEPLLNWHKSLIEWGRDQNLRALNMLGLLAFLRPSGPPETDRYQHVVLSILSNFPDLRNDMAFKRDWQAYLSHSPAYLMFELNAGLDPATPIPEAAARCAHICWSDPRQIGAVVAMLKKHHYLTEEETLEDFLNHLRSALLILVQQRTAPPPKSRGNRPNKAEQANESLRQIDQIESQVLAGILQGDPMPPLARAYRDYWFEAICAHLEHGRALMAVLGLDEAQANELEALAKDFQRQIPVKKFLRF